MSDFFLWFGVTCAGILSVSALMFAVTLYESAKRNSYYDGLLRQIRWTIEEIDTEFDDHEQRQLVDIKHVREILYRLHRREFPRIAEMRADAESAPKPAGGEG